MYSYKKCFFSFIVFFTFVWWSVFADNTFDIGKVEQTWLTWTNDHRKELWLTGYTIDSKLTTTATERSNLAKTRTYISHERKKWDGYYNYSNIEKRFKDRNIVFQNIKRTTFTESIWWGFVKCPKEWDCTEALTKATKSTWNFFMSEKNKKSQPHYKAIVNQYFTVMWVWVSIDPVSKKYYITVHYGTKILEKKIAIYNL